MFKIGDRVTKINSGATDTSRNGWIGTIKEIHEFTVHVLFDQYPNKTLYPVLNQLKLLKTEKLEETLIDRWGF